MKRVFSERISEKKEGSVTEIVESILTKNPCYKAGKKIRVQGLMLHSVGCNVPSAENFVNRWNRPDASRACVHAFIDGNIGRVYQTLPWDHRAWHGGGSSNNTHIGVEMCEPACIEYHVGASFGCTDTEAAMQVVRRTYHAAVELFAVLCKKFDLDPLADGVIVSHREGHVRGIASGHADPEHLWNGLKSGYTMDGFRRDVGAAVAGGLPVPSSAQGREAGEEPVPVQKEDKPRNPPGAGAIREGVMVEVASEAVYYSGKEMPAWVKGEQWQVRSVNGDRAVLGKNRAGTHEINSPVHVKYLTCVPEAK